LHFTVESRNVDAHEFNFALELFGPGASTEMLCELADSVLGQLGCDTEGVPGLAAALEAIVSTLGRGGPSRLEFHARQGHLQIIISSGTEPIWKGSRRLA
jgi:hypothetical protein